MYLCTVHSVNEAYNPLKNTKSRNMFGLFKKKTEKEKLQERYAKLMEEAYNLSTSNRKLSDEKVYEAEEVMKRIENLN